MDSLSQLALGAAVGVAVMGRRTAVWKAAAWGALCGTLPDLDAFIDHGDAVSNMTYHRAESHALFWLTLAAPLIAWVISRFQREHTLFIRWWLAVWLALVTHPLLDWTTIYGTQLALPFTDWPYGLGSMFIIDPLYTLPLLAGVVIALIRRHAGLRWNVAGLALSTAYLGWSFAAQLWVHADVTTALRQQGLRAERVLVTPTPFNTVLWRIVVMDGDRYFEGFRSLLDHGDEIAFDAFESGAALRPALEGIPALQRIARFTHGFYKLSVTGDRFHITDLRMGQEPDYAFSFAIAQRDARGVITPLLPVNEGGRTADLGGMMRWLVIRMGGDPIAPPR